MLFLPFLSYEQLIIFVFTQSSVCSHFLNFDIYISGKRTSQPLDFFLTIKTKSCQTTEKLQRPHKSAKGNYI